MLINGREKERTKKLRNSKAFIEFSQAIMGVYENLEGYNSTKNRKVLIIFDDMIADTEAKKNEVL